MISGDLAGLMRNLTANPFANTLSFQKRQRTVCLLNFFVALSRR